MKPIYLLIGEKRSKITQKDAAVKLKHGLIPDNVSFWTEGMSSWGDFALLVELLNSTSLSESKPLIPIIIPKHDLGQITSVVFIALMSYTVCLVIQCLVLLATIGLNVRGIEAHWMLTTLKTLALFISMLSNVVLIGSIIAFMKWTYRVVDNIRIITQVDTYNATLAVLYYFIPIVNIYSPFNSLVKAYKVTSENDNIPQIFYIWWINGLLSILLAFLTAQVIGLGGQILQGITLTFTIITTICLIKVIQLVRLKQYEFIERSNVQLVAS